jgi:ketosteroid isomerase-like protein
MRTERAEPILPSRDLEETRQFYQQLGFEAWWGGKAPWDYEIVSRGNLVVHFFLDSGLAPDKNDTSCYWRVADAGQLHGELSALQLPVRGIPRLSAPIDQPWGMHEFTIVDPSGNLIRVGHDIRPPDQEDLQALHAIRDRLQAGENAFDGDPLVEVMTDDIVFRVPNEPVLVGKAQCEAFVRRILAEQQAWFDRRISYVSEEVAIHGNTSFDRGTFSFTVVMKHDGSTSEATGKYLWLYERTGGSEWKMSRAILSLDDPPESGATC